MFSDEYIEQQILLNLSCQEILNYSVTNKYISHVCKTHTIWQLLIKRDFPSSSLLFDNARELYRINLQYERYMLYLYLNNRVLVIENNNIGYPGIKPIINTYLLSCNKFIILIDTGIPSIFRFCWLTSRDPIPTRIRVMDITKQDVEIILLHAIKTNQYIIIEAKENEK